MTPLLSRRCAAEFSVASYHGRIVNADDPEVRRITALRAWPKTVAQYAGMMNETSEKKQVKFTSSGDRAIVQFNFFKMCIGLTLQQPSSSHVPGERSVAGTSRRISRSLSLRLGSSASLVSVRPAPEALPQEATGTELSLTTQAPVELTPVEHMA